jgi:hypothetical protein
MSSKFTMAMTSALYSIDRSSQPQKPPPLRHEIDPTRHYPVRMVHPGGSLGTCRVREAGRLLEGELDHVEVNFPIEDLVFNPIFGMGSDGVARLQSVSCSPISR